jgi:putative transposase
LFVAGDGAKWQPSGSGAWAHATFQAVGTLKVRQHRPVPGTVKALQLTREHRRWYVIVIAATQPIPLPPGGRQIGVDVGVARFLTTSDGEVVANPRFLAASAEVIADLQRRKTRARPGSGNRKRIRPALAREWRTVRNRRRDFHHKTARANPVGTSVSCHQCGRRCTRPQQKIVICPVHGVIDADVNGARNIASRAGLGSGRAPTAA